MSVTLSFSSSKDRPSAKQPVKGNDWPNLSLPPCLVGGSSLPCLARVRYHRFTWSYNRLLYYYIYIYIAIIVCNATGLEGEVASKLMTVVIHGHLVTRIAKAMIISFHLLVCYLLVCLKKEPFLLKFSKEIVTEPGQT